MAALNPFSIEGLATITAQVVEPLPMEISDVSCCSADTKY